MPVEEQIMKMKENSKKWWMLKVDLEYPEELHEEHNNYPVAPGKKQLVLTLEDLKNYVVHHRNLRFYLKQGMRLKNVHRAIEFEQERLMEPYIRMNASIWKKTKSDFESNFYKLMNNTVFGKTMENLRNHVDVKIVRSWETDKIRRLEASPLFAWHEIFGNDSGRIHILHKSKLLLNKPVYTGMTILENSKILMYHFFYNYLKDK